MKDILLKSGSALQRRHEGLFPFSPSAPAHHLTIGGRVQNPPRPRKTPKAAYCQSGPVKTAEPASIRNIPQNQEPLYLLSDIFFSSG